MAETDSSPENPQVRKEWVVPRWYSENKPIDYKVIAADNTNLMVSFPLHGGDKDYPYVDRGVAEYSFGVGGGRPNEIRERLFSKSPGLGIWEEGEETDRYFTDFHEQYGGYLNSVIIKKTVEYGELIFDFGNSAYDEGYEIRFSTNEEEDKRLGRRGIGRELAEVSYNPKSGSLSRLKLGRIFERRENEDIDSPVVIFYGEEDGRAMARIVGGSRWGG